jgi:hypothetical protein
MPVYYAMALKKQHFSYLLSSHFYQLSTFSTVLDQQKELHFLILLTTVITLYNSNYRILAGYGGTRRLEGRRECYYKLPSLTLATSQPELAMHKAIIFIALEIHYLQRSWTKLELALKVLSGDDNELFET